jgi:hypothetical protein
MTKPTLDPPIVDDPTRPALETLARDQRDLIWSFVNGFESRADLLKWCGEATISTMGQLDPTWHKERLMSGSELSCLIVDDAERRRYVDAEDLLNANLAKEFRLILASDDLLPACQAGLKSIRWSTVERAADDDDDNHQRVRLDDQDNPAMRPGIGETARRQQWVVDRALAGFESVEEIVEAWVPTAIQASYGEVDDDLASAFWRERPLREMFIERDDSTARWFRETFVATELVPPFNSAVEQLAKRSGEAVATGESTDHSAVTYPSR